MALMTQRESLEFWAAAIVNALHKLVEEHGIANTFYLPEIRAVGGPRPESVGCVMQWSPELVNNDLAGDGMSATYYPPHKGSRAFIRVMALGMPKVNCYRCGKSVDREEPSTVKREIGLGGKAYYCADCGRNV